MIDTQLTPRQILEEVKRRIVADPNSYNQNSFCGSICCIAEHIDVIVNGLLAHEMRVDRDGWKKAIEDIENVGNQALALDCPTWLFGQPDPHQDEDDFCTDQSDTWPLDLSLAYNNSDDKAERVGVALEAIDRFLSEQAL